MKPKHTIPNPGRRPGRATLIVAALLLLALFSALAATVPAGRQLARARADSETAWRVIARLHTARMEEAAGALGALRHASPDQPFERIEAARWTSVFNALARAKAASGDHTALHDPEAINAWKQYQGELTAALFMLVEGAGEGIGKIPPASTSARSLEVRTRLRVQLMREEAALAQARLRYAQASAEYAVITDTMAGTVVATLLDYPELPATL